MICAVLARETKPIWTSSTFLVYTGGLTVLGAAIGALFYLSHEYTGNGQGTAWTLLFFGVLYGIAYALRRAGRPIAAGIFAFSGVIAWGVLVVVAFQWFGWNGVNADMTQWSWAALAAQLLILFAAWDARRRFHFPFIRLISAVMFFVFVVQLLPAGGSWTATWALLVGLLYLATGNVIGKPSTFWLHFVGGALIGGSFLYWFHTSDADFAFISIAALAFVFLANWTRRSIWAVYGTVGFFIATIHYLVGSPTGIAMNALAGQAPHVDTWSYPLGFALLGFWLVLLGMLGRRRRPVAAAAPPPAPAAA